MARKPRAVAENVSPRQIAMAVRRPRPRTWLDSVSPDQRAEILEVCRDIVAGKIPGSINSIADAWAEHGIPVTRDKLKDLVVKVRQGAIE